VNTHDIKNLLDFLDAFGPEVMGRELPQPQMEMAKKLDRFAQGKCDEIERAEVCELLRLHPAWLHWLADRVKLARTHRTMAAQG